MSRWQTARAFFAFSWELWQNRAVVAEFLERMWLARKGALEIAAMSQLDKPLPGFCMAYNSGLFGGRLERTIVVRGKVERVLEEAR